MALGFPSERPGTEKDDSNMNMVFSSLRYKARFLLGLMLCAVLALVISAPRHTVAQEGKAAGKKAAANRPA